MKTTITKNEYLQLVGLMTLAVQHQNKVDEANSAMSAIVGNDEEYTLLTDAIYDGASVDDVLKKMKITVEELGSR